MENSTQTQLISAQGAEMPQLPEKSKKMQLREYIALRKTQHANKDKDPVQRKAAGNIIKFFALVIIFTIIARGSYGAFLPRVSTARPSKGEITDVIAISANIFAAKEEEIFIPEDIMVDEVFAGGGEKLQNGDALLRFNQADFEEKLARVKIELEELELSYKQAMRSESHDTSALNSAEKGLARTKDDYNKGINEIDESINSAKHSLDSAQAELNRLLAIIANDNAKDEEKQAAAAALPDAENAVKTAQDTLDGINKQAETSKLNLVRALEDAQAAYEDAKQREEKEKQNTADTNEQNKLRAQGILLDLEKKREEFEEMEKIKAGGYIFTAPLSGEIRSIINEGTKSGQNAAATIFESSAGFVAKALINEKQSQRLNVGDKCDIAVGTSSVFSYERHTGTVKSIGQADENGNCEIEISLPDAKWKNNQSIDVQFIMDKQNHNMVIPLAALRSDSSGYYVLCLQKQNTVLGVENILSRLPVDLIAQDENSAAVEGPLSTNDELIISSDKPVGENDKVRLND